MISAPWLHPDFRLVLDDTVTTAADLHAEAAVLASDLVAGGCNVIVAPNCRTLLLWILVSQQRHCDLFVVREIADAAARMALVGDRDQGTGLVWLQTSGTTGVPKWVAHRLDRLMGRLAPGERAARWLLTYNPASFAGLQVMLSATLGGHTLVAAEEARVTALAELAVRHRITHLSATPTFWRAFLMALPNRQVLPLKMATLGGEAADQPLLDGLKARFPQAALRHIYATTEAGTIFTVTDGRAGFPAAWLESGIGAVRLSITETETLAISSPRMAMTVGSAVFDTGDCVQRVGDRLLFRGRHDTMVNIGGVKVWAEEVERHLLKLPFVHDVLVSARPSPVTGHVIAAEIVLAAGEEPASREEAIKTHLQALPRAARPASIRYSDALPLGTTGKKRRNGS